MQQQQENWFYKDFKTPLLIRNKRALRSEIVTDRKLINISIHLEYIQYIIMFHFLSDFLLLLLARIIMENERGM